MSNERVILQISKYEQDAINGMPYNEKCSKDIIPFISETFRKIRENRDIFEGKDISRHVEKISILIRNLACNTHENEIMNSKDLKSISQIFFDVVYALFDEVKENAFASEEDKNILYNKINCINEIVYANMIGNHFPNIIADDNIHDGKIFQNYENLLKVISYITENFESLTKRGFTLNVFYNFENSFRYDRRHKCEKTEEEKFNMFMGILDGSMKFKPIYEVRTVAYAVVPIDFDDNIVKYSNVGLLNEYALKREDE